VIIGIGTDVVDVPLFRASLTDDIIGTRFLPGEIAYCEGRARPWECFAARAAAKRAAARALGMADELGLVAELVRGNAGDVELVLSGAALEAAVTLGATDWSVSIAHTKNTALAVVVLESPDDCGIGDCRQGTHERRKDGS